MLVGDPAQLPAVGAGGLFAALVERHGAVELTTTTASATSSNSARSRSSATAASRDYLAHAAEQGRLTVADSRTEAKARLVADWWRPRQTTSPAA